MCLRGRRRYRIGENGGGLSIELGVESAKWRLESKQRNELDACMYWRWGGGVTKSEGKFVHIGSLLRAWFQRGFLHSEGWSYGLMDG